VINSDDREETTFTIEDENNTRIDALLAKTFPDQSRSYFQKLIDGGSVLLNGVQPKKQTRPERGDTISLSFDLIQEIHLEPENIPLNIIYEDEHLICVNKACGMVVHPAPGHWRGTLANALLYHFNNLPGDDQLRPGIVHRIDKDTTGLLLVAKTPQCHRKLIEAFSSRKIKKEYIAITWGKPSKPYISAPIGRHPKNRKIQALIEEGRESYTSFDVLEINNGFALVKAHPFTGRTHQIRVHLQALGAPILADPLYGSRTAQQKHPNDRLQLHAYRLNFQHPITGEEMDLKANIPEDMKRLIKHLFNGSYE
jgi:23S rRNA pseudouridine1911/1915/1917 synthase